MSARHSTSSSAVVKPSRLTDSPLFWHASGRWTKKIRGKFAYFGRGSHADAIAEYERTKTDLHTGRRPHEEEPGELNVYQLCAKFLITKREQRGGGGGELSARMFAEYGAVCMRLIKVLGKTRPVTDLGPDDFATLRKRMAKTWGPVRLKAEIIETGFHFYPPPDCPQISC